MSRPRATHRELIDDLASGLEPVRRFPSLPVAWLGVGLVWIGVAVLAWRLQRPGPDWAVMLTGSPVFVAVTLGLLLAAAAAPLAAIAGVVPGREVVARRARVLAVAGLGLAAVAGAGATLLGLGEPPPPLAKDAGCLVLGALVGVPPLIALVLLARWGVVQRPSSSTCWALLGAGGLGGLAVQIGCHYPGARHMLLAHVGVPIAMGLIGAVPLGLLVRRLAVRQRAAA